MPSIKYDPEVIQKFADELYRKADNLIQFWTLLGLITGLIIGLIIGVPITAMYKIPTTANVFVGVVLGCMIGFRIGSSRTFALKLQAQMTLCFKQTEENTRKIEIVCREFICDQKIQHL